MLSTRTSHLQDRVKQTLLASAPKYSRRAPSVHREYTHIYLGTSSLRVIPVSTLFPHLYYLRRVAG